MAASQLKRRSLQSADPEVLTEDAERPLGAAVALLKQAEATAGVPEALAPDNYLLCAEAALGIDNVPLAHQCAERFLRSRPAKSQFLVRAYYALGRVQAAYSYGLKAKELLDSTMAALSQLQHGITMAAELGLAHRAAAGIVRACALLLAQGAQLLDVVRRLQQPVLQPLERAVLHAAAVARPRCGGQVRAAAGLGRLGA